MTMEEVFARRGKRADLAGTAALLGSFSGDDPPQEGDELDAAPTPAVPEHS